GRRTEAVGTLSHPDPASADPEERGPHRVDANPQPRGVGLGGDARPHRVVGEGQGQEQREEEDAEAHPGGGALPADQRRDLPRADALAQLGQLDHCPAFSRYEVTVVQAVSTPSFGRGSMRREVTRTTPGPCSSEPRKSTSLGRETSVSVRSTLLSMIRPSPTGTSPLGVNPGMSSPAFRPFSST